MTDLLTPDKVREMLTQSVAADKPLASRLCRDYLTLWDRNEELEKQVQMLNTQSRITGRGERYL